jgi:SAM-dependent methyltransferase
VSDLNPYRAQWDGYVEQWRRPPQSGDSRTGISWPGDEWGNEELWARIFLVLFGSAGVDQWKHCVEIGPGSGKYTNLVLRNSRASITAFDISPAYLAVLRQRLSAEIAEGRVDPVLIPAERTSELLEHIERKGLARQLDAFYSIDALVHVDLQYLLVYIITAALCLKERGHLILTLANAVSDLGFSHMIETLKFFYPLQGKPSSKFEYTSPEMVRVILERIGFTVQFPAPFSTVEKERDLYLVATLTDPGKADGFRQAIV